MKGRDHAKRRAFLEAMGWSADEVESLLACPTKQLVSQTEDLLCCSAEGRRKLRECKAYFPQAKIVSVS